MYDDVQCMHIQQNMHVFHVHLSPRFGIREHITGLRKLCKVSNIEQHSLPTSSEIYASQCVDEAESSMPDVLGYWFVSKAGIPFLTLLSILIQMKIRGKNRGVLSAMGYFVVFPQDVEEEHQKLQYELLGLSRFSGVVQIWHGKKIPHYLGWIIHDQSRTILKSRFEK